MPRISKCKLQSRHAYQASASKQKAIQREKYICDINQILIQTDDDEL
ncbi:23169_t:CDS:1, partial [Cetraspora pellucida]